jgi:CHAD domain-containing protein
MADALSEVNPGPGWRKVKKSSRDLFKVLGELRNTHVEREWIKKLAPPREAVRGHLLRLLARREKEQRGSVHKALEEFSLKNWKKLDRKLERRVRLFPLESVVFQRLALAKLEEAAELFSRARKSRSAAAWHRARIGLKQFRYISENFLPHRFAPYSPNVKHLQDLLGEVHDLDVLRLDLRRNSSGLDVIVVGGWQDRILAERKLRLGEVISRTSGSGSLLATWRAGFQIAHAITAGLLLNRRTA